MLPMVLQAQPDILIRINTLGPNEFYIRSQLAAGSIIMDVRELKMYKKSRIPGALSIPDASVLHAFSDSLDRDVPIFVYCDGSTRSQTACSLLIDRGFQNVALLKGGLMSWESVNLPMDKRRVAKRQSGRKSSNRNLH